MQTIVNKVAESGILTLNLEELIPSDIVVFDLKPFLFMELILKEKEFREALKNHDWEAYKDKAVALTCSADAIIPVWAYMLVASSLTEVAAQVLLADEAHAQEAFLLQAIEQIDPSHYMDKRVVIKGCGDIPIPTAAYVAITHRLKSVVKSLMYGEPCSTVPVYKKKSLLTK